MHRTAYRLHQETLSVFCSEPNKSEFIYIPAGTVISLTDDQGSGKFAEVVWEDKTVLMFSEDLRERAEPIFDPIESVSTQSKRLHA